MTNSVMTDIEMKPDSTAEEVKARVSTASSTPAKPKSLFDLTPTSEFRSEGFKSLLAHLTDNTHENLPVEESPSQSQTST